MKLSSAVFFFTAIVPWAGAQSGCVNQASPRQGIGNYCWCSSNRRCYSSGVKDGQLVCEPVGRRIPCP
ncbi:hypothetical protein NHJ13051_008449 [Beauveria bassiana]